MIGIYKITNLLNDKVYIGQSVHIERRFQEHCGSNVDSYIHNAIQKYGKDNFKFEVIEQCNPKDLDKREEYWIQFYNSLKPNGYNLVLGNNNSNIQTKDSIIPVLSIIQDLQNTDLTIVEIGAKYDLHPSIISRINLGQTHYQTNIVYPIRQKTQKIEKKIVRRQHVCECCGVKINPRSKRCNKCEGLHRRIPLEDMPVDREKLKTLIRTTPFTTIGKQFNVTDNAVRKWCDKFNLPRKSSIIKKITEEEWEKI